MNLDAEPDFAAMTAEEMDEWIDAEEAKTPFTSFDLGTDEGRRALLFKYYRIGDTSLFEAVSHVWTSLNEPRAAYCTQIGLAAGTGGKGKRGLVLALHKFLSEALNSINWIPSRENFVSLEEWHLASMKTWVDDEENLCVLLRHYSIVLNGGAAPKAAGKGDSVVLQGPRALKIPAGTDRPHRVWGQSARRMAEL